MITVDNVIIVLGSLAALSIGVERSTEIVKVLCNSIKAKFPTKITKGLDKYSIEIISIVTGILSAWIIGFRLGLGIDMPVVLQYIIAGLIASMGSNVLHTLISTLIGIKNNSEVIK